MRALRMIFVALTLGSMVAVSACGAKPAANSSGPGNSTANAAQDTGCFISRTVVSAVVGMSYKPLVGDQPVERTLANGSQGSLCSFVAMNGPSNEVMAETMVFGDVHRGWADIVDETKTRFSSFTEVAELGDDAIVRASDDGQNVTLFVRSGNKIYQLGVNLPNDYETNVDIVVELAKRGLALA